MKLFYMKLRNFLLWGVFGDFSSLDSHAFLAIKDPCQHNYEQKLAYRLKLSSGE